MKRFLLFLLLACSAYGQAPLQRNSWTTNTSGKAPTPLPTTTSALWPLMILDPGVIAGDRSIAYAPAFYMSNGVAHFAGNVNMHTLTAGTLLQVNGGLNVVSLANGADGTLLGISNGLPAYVNAPTQVWTNNGTVLYPIPQNPVALGTNDLSYFGYSPFLSGQWNQDDSTAAGVAFVNKMTGSSGNTALLVETVDGGGYTGHATSIAGYARTAGPGQGYFIGGGAIGLSGRALDVTTTNADGYAHGITGYARTRLNNQSAIVGAVGANRDGATNLAIGGRIEMDSHTGVTVGGYFEANAGIGDDPILESAILITDNRDTGIPLILGRTNNGTTVFKVDYDGSLLLSGTTNRYTDDGTQLLRNGTPVGSGSATNPTQNYYSTSNYFTVGKGGKLTVTNGITTLDVAASSLLRVDSNQKIAPATVGTGLSFDGTTLSASGGGGGSALYVNGTSVTNANLKDSGSITYTTTATTNIAPTIAAQAFNLLAYSGGTNVTIDCSLGNAMEAHYYLTVTNTAFFATPTSVPTTAKRFVMHLKNDSTGGYAVTFTNGTFSWSEGVMPVHTTNASAVDVFEFVTSPFTNTDLIGTMVQNVHR